MNLNIFLHREKKIEGLNFVRCLSAYHATVLIAKLHETSLAVAQEVKFYYQNISLTIYVYMYFIALRYTEMVCSSVVSFPLLDSLKKLSLLYSKAAHTSDTNT